MWQTRKHKNLWINCSCNYIYFPFQNEFNIHESCRLNPVRNTTPPFCIINCNITLPAAIRPSVCSSWRHISPAYFNPCFKMHYFTQCFMFIHISSNFLLFLVLIAPNLLPFSVGWFLRKSNLKLFSYSQRGFDNETTFSGLSVWSISCHKFTGQWAHPKQSIMKHVFAVFQQRCMVLRIQHIIHNSNTFESALSHSKH